MSSYTTSDSYSFTITHAKYLGAKVATDLKRIQRFYLSSLTDAEIMNFERELIVFLKAGFLKRVTYGFKKEGKWIKPTLQYTADELADSYYATDDDPGRIRPGYDISGAYFSSFLVWDYGKASEKEIEVFKQELPFDRSIGMEPSANGSWHSDLTYTSGNRSLNRSHLS